MTAFSRRYFAGGGTTTTLTSSMSASDTSFTISSATGWPGSPGNPYIVVIDRGTSSEEKILCTSNSGTTVTVTTRGYDGTSATTHNASAIVSLCGGAIDFDEANQVTNLLGNAAEGSLFYGKGAGVLPAKLAVGTAGQLLTNNGTDPAWLTALAEGSLLYGKGTTTNPAALAIGAAGTLLGSNGTDPAWTTRAPSVTITSTTAAVMNTSYKVSSGTFTITLPAPVAGGFVKVTNYGSGVPVVSQNASEVIYGLGCSSAGQASIKLGTYGATATLESDGTSWYITAGMQDSGWLTVGGTGVAFTNSFANGGSLVTQYRKAGNSVEIQGRVITGASGNSAFTLPTGFRPTTNLLEFASASNGSFAAFVVATTGAVTPTFPNTYCDLNCTFEAD